MVWLPDGEKSLNIIYLFVSTEYTKVTDGQTERQLGRRADGHRATAYAALMQSIARQKL